MTAQGNRGELEFSESARATFRFLEEAYGFRVAQSTSTLVRYVKGTLYANVFHGRQSYELGFEIARSDHSEELTNPFREADMIGLSNEEASRRYKRWSASDAGSTRRGLEALAHDVEVCGADVLRGQAEAFDEMRERRHRRSAEYADDVRLRQLRTEVEAAWSRMDYGRVAALLGAVTVGLSQAERAKLEYARKHLGN